jgi:hypothetical protein
MPSGGRSKLEMVVPGREKWRRIALSSGRLGRISANTPQKFQQNGIFIKCLYLMC